MKPRRLLEIMVLITLMVPSAYADDTKPNVVVVITDDQGYGDLAFTGNPTIKTPTLDKLSTQATLLNNFHVDPTCAPTRSALMTGRYSDRVGVWHTVQGRSMLRRREVTMADIFGSNGYATGMFGKWHLGGLLSPTDPRIGDSSTASITKPAASGRLRITGATITLMTRTW